MEDSVIHLAEIKILLISFLTYQPRNAMFFEKGDKVSLR